MDFLDPKEKRNRGIRLAIGYGLMSVLVLLATAVLYFRAYGFDLDRRGNVVQNGLAFFDSVPDGASIFLNGVEQGRKTNVRLSLQEGLYSIQLRKDGYLPWNNRMDLGGGTVERFYYPLLIPQKLKTHQQAVFKSPPSTLLQSPDRHWLLINRPGSISRFIRYDSTKLDDSARPESTSVSIPAGLLSTAPGAHKLKLIEWASDNKSVLLKHSWPGGDEFILFDHDKPADSVNLDKLLGADLPSVKLRDKKPDQYYIYSKKTKVLSTADLDTQRVNPLLRGVTSHDSYDDNLLYVRSGTSKQDTKIVLRLGDDEYVIKELKGHADVDVDLAKFDGDWYPVFSVASEKKAYIYKNPQDIIGSRSDVSPPPIMVLKLHRSPEHLSFSGNDSKVMINNGQEFSVYDIEYDRPYRYTVGQKLDTPVRPAWMDSHRLLARRNDAVFVFDFDGKNGHVLSPALSGLPAVFDRDYKRMYTLAESKGKKNQTTLLQTDLRVPADL